VKESLIEKLKKDTVDPLGTTDYLSILIEIRKFIEADNTHNVVLRQGLLSLEQVSKEAKNNNEAILKGKEILELLVQDLPATKSDPLKTAIFHVLLNDCIDYYRSDEDVNNTYQWLKEIDVRWNSVVTLKSDEEIFFQQNKLISEYFTEVINEQATLDPMEIELTQILKMLGVAENNSDINDLS
jgi:hypothetical protein